jgi:hypothetical protein
MNPSAHSRSYKLAKLQLARPPQKHSVAFCLVVSLFFPGIFAGVLGSGPMKEWVDASTWSGALKLSADMMLSAAYYSGGMMLSVAYYGWLLKGYRQIIEEQAKPLEEARASQLQASD